MLLQCIGKGGSLLNVLLDIFEYPFESPVFLLAVKNFKTLHQRQTGIYHGSKLAGHDNYVFFGHPGLQKLDVFE